MNTEVNIEEILKIMREEIGDKAQQIAILKAHINTLSGDNKETTNL